MSSIIVASIPAHGHITPLLTVAENFIKRGDDVRFVTGARYAGKVAAAVGRIKRHTKLPVCVGFGIRTPETARAIASRADGAVVGTALVDALRGSLDGEGRATAKTVSAVAGLAASLASGVRSAKQAAAGRHPGGTAAKNPGGESDGDL